MPDSVVANYSRRRQQASATVDRWASRSSSVTGRTCWVSGVRLLQSSPHAFGRVLWPFVTLPAYERPVFVRLSEYVSVFICFLSTDDAIVVIVGAAVVYVTIGVWIVDGRPGLAPIRRSIERSYDCPTDRND